MSLRDREDPAGALDRHRDALARAEARLEAAADDAIRDFLAKVRRAITPRGLTAATGDLFPQAAHLFTIGEASGWWQEAVDERLSSEVAAVWRAGHFDTRDGELLRSSQEAVSGYVANVTDRLSRTATPTLPEAAFDKARVALTDEMARGSSTRETSRRLAAEFGWDEDARFWSGRKEELTGRIESILDPYGPPGTPDREWQRLNNPEVRDLQRQSSEATRHIDAVQSEWQTRAERIARTETTGAYNAGALDAGKKEKAGVKVWLAIGDDRTRDSHLEASNSCVGVDDSFDVGGEAMQMPGDPSAPPEETVNCRCTIVFAASCEEADGMYPVVDPERAHEQALAEDEMRTAPGEAAHREPDSFRVLVEDEGPEIELPSEVTETLDRLNAEWGQTVDTVAVADYTGYASTGGPAGNVRFAVNRDTFLDDAFTSARQQEMSPFMVGTSREATITHEFGHAIERRLSPDRLAAVQSEFIPEAIRTGGTRTVEVLNLAPSTYALENAAEWSAEMFALGLAAESGTAPSSAGAAAVSNALNYIRRLRQELS